MEFDTITKSTDTSVRSPRTQAPPVPGTPPSATGLEDQDDFWIPARVPRTFDFGYELRAGFLVLVRHWKRLALGICASLIAGFAFTLFSPSQYQSSVELLPNSSDEGIGAMGGMSAAMGLASSLGFNLGAPSMAMAYPDLLKSRQIRERILDSEFEAQNGRHATLQCLLDFPAHATDAERALALHRLDRRIRVSIDKESGVLKLVATMPDAKLARDVAAAYVEELIKIENELKAGTSIANRDFIERRLEESESALKQAETEATIFQEQNPVLGSDPELQLEAARLTRAVRVQEEIYLTLTRQFELAKIEANRKSIGIQVIDPPKLALSQSSPILVKNLALSGFLGLVTFSLLILVVSRRATLLRELHAFLT
jgi:uncharacterized protein involved in exopolysaccharide biosynthesis